MFKLFISACASPSYSYVKEEHESESGDILSDTSADHNSSDDSDDGHILLMEHIEIKTGQKNTTYWSNEKIELFGKSNEYEGVVKKITKTIPSDIFRNEKKKEVSQDEK